jgi:hypothetical protein
LLFYVLLAGLILGVAVVIFAISVLGPDSRLGQILNANLVASFVSSGVLGAVIGSVTLLVRRAYPRLPVIGGPEPRGYACRKVIDRKDLSRLFKTDGSFSPLRMAGWRAVGGGSRERSIAEYANVLSGSFTIAAQVRAVRKTPESKYWRVGFYVKRPDGAEKVCFHVDSHDLVVGYIDRRKVLSVTAPERLEESWSLLGLQVSKAPNCTECRVYGQCNGITYWIGTLHDITPLKVTVEAWSDHHKHHIVDIRDISIDEATA